ncbi:MAG: ankyrin repeat domain-containing protein [Pseudomonadota bacterium]
MLIRVLMLASLLGLAGVASADSKGDFLLAVQLDDVGTVSKLLPSLGPNLTEPNRGETGLILALREDAMRVFNVLLADPRVQLEQGADNTNTALMMAAFKRNRAAVEALLAKGAAVNRPGWNALHYAAVGGDPDIVIMLLARKAAIDATAPARMTALMLAAREGQEEAVAVLLKAGANPALKNGEGFTAYDIAVKADKPHIVALLPKP